MYDVILIGDDPASDTLVKSYDSSGYAIRLYLRLSRKGKYVQVLFNGNVFLSNATEELLQKRGQS